MKWWSVRPYEWVGWIVSTVWAVYLSAKKILFFSSTIYDSPVLFVSGIELLVTNAVPTDGQIVGSIIGTRLL